MDRDDGERPGDEAAGAARAGDQAGAFSDAIGLLGVFVAILGLNHLLWIRLWDLASGLRSAVLAVVAFAAFRTAGGCLAPGKDGAASAPRSARTLGLFAAYAFAAGLMEAGRAWGLPPSPLAGLALAGVCLGTGQAVGSLLLAQLGALALYSTLAGHLALGAGRAGGILTDAIFVALPVALALAAAGLYRLRRQARVVGLGLARVGATLALLMLLLLSIHGNGYHGLGPEAWAGTAWTAALIVGCMAWIRLAVRARAPRLAGAASWFLCLRALHAYHQHGAWLLPPFVAFLGAGVVLLTLSTALDRYARQVADGLPEADRPAAGPPPDQPPATRQKTLALTLLLACLALGGSHLRGLADALLPARAELRVRVLDARCPPILVPMVDPTGIDSPADAVPGDALDVHLFAAGTSQGILAFGPAIATRPGAPVPPGLGATRTLTVPGHRVSVRAFDGSTLELVVPRLRTWLDVPVALWGEPAEDQDLILRVGRLGTIRPVRIEAPDEPGSSDQ